MSFIVAGGWREDQKRRAPNLKKIYRSAVTWIGFPDAPQRFDAIRTFLHNEAFAKLLPLSSDVNSLNIHQNLFDDVLPKVNEQNKSSSRDANRELAEPENYKSQQSADEVLHTVL